MPLKLIKFTEAVFDFSRNNRKVSLQMNQNSFISLILNKEAEKMAKTEAGKKKVFVHSHDKVVNGKKVHVPNHYRSTPN